MNTLKTISIKDTRNQISQIVEQVAIAKKRYLITKFGKPKAMIIPIEKIGKNIAKSGILATAGAWKDRKDIKDSAKWVARLRNKMSSRYGKNIFT